MGDDSIFELFSVEEGEVNFRESITEGIPWKDCLEFEGIATISDRVCLGDKKMTMRGISGVVGMHISWEMRIPNEAFLEFFVDLVMDEEEVF